MKRVFVCSPLSPTMDYSVEENLALVERLCRVVMLAGHAPFAPHLIYPRFMNDTDKRERDLGIAAGVAWLGMADEIWIYANDLSECSNGMLEEVTRAKTFSISPLERWMPSEWSKVAPRKRLPLPKVIEPVRLRGE